MIEGAEARGGVAGEVAKRCIGMIEGYSKLRICGSYNRRRANTFRIPILLSAFLRVYLTKLNATTSTILN